MEIERKRRKMFLDSMRHLLMDGLESISKDVDYGNDYAREAGYYKGLNTIARLNVEYLIKCVDDELHLMQETGDDFDGEGRII